MTSPVPQGLGLGLAHAAPGLPGQHLLPGHAVPDNTPWARIPRSAWFTPPASLYREIRQVGCVATLSPRSRPPD